MVSSALGVELAGVSGAGSRSAAPVQALIWARLEPLPGLLRQTALQEDVGVYRNVCAIVAQRLESVRDLVCGVVAAPQFSAEALRQHLGIRSLVPSKLLAVLLGRPGQSVAISELATLCQCEELVVNDAIRDLRKYLCARGLGDELFGNELSGYAITPELADILVSTRQSSNLPAVVTDNREVLTLVLQRDLALSSRGEARVLQELLREAGAICQTDWLLDRLVCTPSSIRVWITRLRKNLRQKGLSEAIVNIPRKGKKVPGGYTLVTQAWPVLQRHISFDLLEAFPDLSKCMPERF